MALITAPAWPYGESVVAVPLISFPANRALPSGIRTFPDFHLVHSLEMKHLLNPLNRGDRGL